MGLRARYSNSYPPWHYKSLIYTIHEKFLPLSKNSEHVHQTNLFQVPPTIEDPMVVDAIRIAFLTALPLPNTLAKDQTMSCI